VRKKVKPIKACLLLVLVFILSVSILSVSMMPSALAYASYPLQPTDTEVADALDYLRGELQTDGSIGDFATSAWATMAVAAAGEDPNTWKVASNPSIVDYLASNASSAVLVNDYSRMILASVAADEDPTAFGGTDFVALVEASYDGTQIDDAGLLNDDFWAILALVSAGKNPASDIVANPMAFVKSNQNGDGGWGWGVGSDSDADDTAAAIMALVAAGELASSTAIQNALAYIKSTQMDNGGFESWGATNSATDSWGIDAIAAAGEDPTSAAWQSGSGNDPVDDLLTFQNADGSFNWQPTTPSNVALMTAYAISALLGEPYPVKSLPPEPAAGETVGIRIEGQSSTIWQGDVTVTESTITDEGGVSHHLPDPTALGALDEASQAGGFPYVVQDTAYGLYLYSVNGEEPAGMSGWMYLVDYNSPMVGAADFILGQTTPPNPPHTGIVFFWGAWDDTPSRLVVDKAAVAVDEVFTATVTYYDSSGGTTAPR
jgi:iron complex transport system substrate-binding protein